jgi:hypothetical protein
MSLSARHLLAGPWIGAIFSLLICGIVLPTEAVAGCAAHYLNARLQLPEELDGLESQLLGGHSPAEQSEAPRPRPVPCTGAMCSGQPSTPMTAGSSLPPPTSEQWAMPVERLKSANSIAFELCETEPNLCTVNRPATIFHPPRPASFSIIS